MMKAKGVCVITKAGEMLFFENGNDGEGGEYRKYIDSKVGKKTLSCIFATPYDVAEALREGATDSEKIRDLKYYLEDFNDDIKEIEKIVYGD